MTLDWTAIWGVVGPAAIGFGTWLKMRKPNQAKIEAAVAQARADTSISDAEGVLYRRLREDIEALRGEMVVVRNELADERRHNRELVTHVWKLENLMRAANLTVPEFEPTPRG